MRTEFQKKVESHISKQRTGELHWTWTGSTLIRLPSELGGETFTPRRVIYAMMIGDIPGGFELNPNCGHKYCIKPEHQKLFEKPNSTAKPLSLINELAVLTPAKTGYIPAKLANTLPEGITIALIEKVKKLMIGGSTLNEVAFATDLDKTTIMKINNGGYDRAAKNVRSATNRGRAEKHLRATLGLTKVAASELFQKMSLSREVALPPVNMEEDAPEPRIASSASVLKMMEAMKVEAPPDAVLVIVDESAAGKEPWELDVDMTEEEREWLRQNTRKNGHGSI